MGISDIGDDLEGLDEAVQRHPSQTGRTLQKYADKEQNDEEEARGDPEGQTRTTGEKQTVGARKDIQKLQQTPVQVSRLQQEGSGEGSERTPSRRESREQHSREFSGDAPQLSQSPSQSGKEGICGNTQASERDTQGANPMEQGEEDRGRSSHEGLENKAGKALTRYVDSSMFEAAPMKGIEPEVYLLWMTPDPLGAVAAACRMYEGKPTYSLAEITDDERRKYWAAMQDTALNAPLEVIKMHFFIENVDRAFTHQLVRQRTAVYFQESLRFAVKEESLRDIVQYPPSLDSMHVFDNQSGSNDARDVWDAALDQIEDSYKWLIAQGVPAEDARGLLPTAIPTRIHYVTDLRNMLDHAGNRLCTQAQFHWRMVFMKIREAIREHGEEEFYEHAIDDIPGVKSESDMAGWQHKLITDTAFVPKCYQQGKCTFDSNIDRGCTIRPRVDALARQGIPSSMWEDEKAGALVIDRSEWLDDPRAAWQ